MYTPDKILEQSLQHGREISYGSKIFFPAFKTRTIRISILLLLVLWCTGFSVHALLPENNIWVFYPFLSKIYSSFCHQNEERCIYFGHSFLVCARCGGIYLGAAAASIVSVLFFLNSRFHFNLRSGVFFTLPVICDLIFYNLGLYSYSPSTAFTTGLILGSAALIFILSIIENNFSYNTPESN